jgi:hypothetical protein
VLSEKAAFFSECTCSPPRPETGIGRYPACILEKPRSLSKDFPPAAPHFFRKRWLPLKETLDARSEGRSSLPPPGRRLGRPQGRQRAPDRAAHSRQRRGNIVPHEPAGWIRLPRLRLARPEAYVVFRVLRERGKGGGLGSDFKALHARVFRGTQRRRADGLERLPAGNGRTDHSSFGLRRGLRSLRSSDLGRGVRNHRRASQCAARSQHG